MEKSPDKRPQKVGEILRIIEALEKHYKNSDNADISGFQRKRIVAQLRDDKTEVSKKIHSDSDSKADSGSDYDSEDQLTWPNSKPIQKIVFPRIVTISSETFASLWVMLNKQDIINRMSSIRYNQFLFLNSPHPMVLWITVIYNKKYHARWLPCYLDLKTGVGQQVTEYLAKLGSYQILFFAMEEPKRCQYKMTSSIAPSQCTIMKEWIECSKLLPNTKSSSASKKRLKEELEKLKPKILMKLEDSNK
jgi:serine/threonine-protein kinase